VRVLASSLSFIWRIDVFVYDRYINKKPRYFTRLAGRYTRNFDFIGVCAPAGPFALPLRSLVLIYDVADLSFWGLGSGAVRLWCLILLLVYSYMAMAP